MAIYGIYCFYLKANIFSHALSIRKPFFYVLRVRSGSIWASKASKASKANKADRSYSIIEIPRMTKS